MSLVIAGIAVGRFGLVDQFPDHLEEISTITGNGLTIFLCVLIAIIGFDLGLSGTVAANLKSVGLKVLAFPLAILAGTMLAGGGAAMAFGFLPQGKHRHLCRVRLVFLRSGHHHGGGASVRGGRCGGVSP